MRLKMLVIRWSGMGDIIMTLPAIKWLRDHFEDCYISYLTDIAFAKILEKSGLVHRVVTIDLRGFTTGSRFRQTNCLATRTRSSNCFDYCIGSIKPLAVIRWADTSSA